MQILAANQSLVALERLSRSIKEGSARKWAVATGPLCPLCHRVAEQRKKIARLEAKEKSRSVERPSTDSDSEGIRFSARSVKAQRTRIGLSAKDHGRLVGVAGLTIYNWEQGKSRPRKSQLAALAAVRGIGKREALARLSNGEA